MNPFKPGKTIYCEPFPIFGLDDRHLCEVEGCRACALANLELPFAGAINWYVHYTDHNTMPREGGLGNQPNIWWETINVLKAASGNHFRRKQEKAEEENKRAMQDAARKR